MQPSSDMILNPAHYTVYPVQPIEVTRYLGFCLGNAAKYVLRAPWKGGEEDCLKALRYLDMERECPQPLITVPIYKSFSLAANRLVRFFYRSGGDDLWRDIALQSAAFMENLHFYLGLPDKSCMENMRFAAIELRRILALRDTTGQIYEGMTGLPVAEE